jgi:uncharacterized OB-fold protein
MAVLLLYKCLDCGYVRYRSPLEPQCSLCGSSEYWCISDGSSLYPRSTGYNGFDRYDPRQYGPPPWW